MRRVGWLAVALAVAVAVAYAPALEGEFLAWDDDRYVTENPHIQGGLSRATLYAVFTTIHTGNWIPLTWLSHALDLTLFGLEPCGHHAVNVALHVANTVLLFLLLHRMTAAPWRSAVVAALFGLHPIHVESVAWIAERKDVLSTTFWMLTTLAYVRWVARPSRARWAATLVTLVLGLLAKPMLMTLPFTLLLLDRWPLRRRLSRQTIGEKASLFGVALALGTVAFAAQRAAGTMELGALVSPGERLANAIVSYVRYLGLAIWPVDLSPWHSHPAIEGPPLGAAQVAGAAAILAAVTGIAVLGHRRWPYLLVGWLWYLGALLPVIGLAHIGAHGMAERYTYVPLIGPCIAVVWGVAALLDAGGRAVRRVGAGLTVGLLVVLAILTWRQTQVWHDSMTFWTHTIAQNPRAGVGHYALANLHARARRVDAAMAHYRRALDLRPEPWNWHVELAELAERHGDRETARLHYEQAVVRRPGDAVLHLKLGTLLMQQRRDAAARRHLVRALELAPDLARAHDHLGIVLERAGDLEAAEREFQAALALAPNLASARANLRMVQAAMRRAREAE